jgi:hypothetical protein
MLPWRLIGHQLLLVTGEFENRLKTIALPFSREAWTCGNASPAKWQGSINGHG